MRNRAFVLDQNDRVLSTLEVPLNEGIDTSYMTVTVQRCFRPESTVTWIVDQDDRAIGHVTHHGRFLGTVILANSEMVEKYPTVVPLIYPHLKGNVHDE